MEIIHKVKIMRIAYLSALIILGSLLVFSGCRRQVRDGDLTEEIITARTLGLAYLEDVRVASRIDVIGEPDVDLPNGARITESNLGE